MQAGDPAFLAIGTQVSAKYKGAYCEAKVKTVDKSIKIRVSLRGAHGTTGPSLNIRDKDIVSINGDGNLVTNAVIKLKHPDTNETVEATVKQIQDQSKYTVIFDDGDIATLRRNALCMKSGKHFNASESLDNLPLTHPEHFGTPVGSRRRRFGEEYEEEEDEDSSDDEAESVPYISKLGTVVCVEVSDKKS